MRKIGIISLYFNNRNYGGLLQAYALTKFINQSGHEAEQLCWQNRGPDKRTRIKLSVRNLFCYAKKAYRKISSLVLVRFIKDNLSIRNNAFKNFEEKIPHSQQIYKRESISESLDDYDIFITGSDQVFNLQWYQGEYFLDFVPDDKRKLSYAASMPDICISDEQKEIVKSQLERFDAISVREKESADFLSRLTGKKVEWLLDPTLLLDKQEWDEICAERVIADQYIFCYFLGFSLTIRKRVSSFAKKMGLKLVTLPHLCGGVVEDICFGDIKLYDVSPEQFISLIKHAEYVFTDSFHAAVFSNIYEKKYFVFERAGAKSMSSRVINLLKLMNDEGRFCVGERNKVDYILSLKDKVNSKPISAFYQIKEKSKTYLQKNLSAK